ncbi:FecCD family ABC transporter permease [Dyadobacter fermentans]|uniref:Transport system permease protein n=1 Tax=Dyadobacter fermentans (strain ATCC 700827 / DSM 18053 / CIP 107007 / KCTC 52180 / NS114) TaxID=471854 RepID=C6VTX6_DYAFD|nr:iron ABC transporter permease [Dyadobacter fermentans]ACT94744.1 transport system permease protein [Dyadobacter fermentans DSM 18053]
MLTETVNEREATKAETFQKHILPSSMAKMVWILGAILLACVILAACTGALSISLRELWQIIAMELGWISETQVEEQKSVVFWVIRLPRVCLAVLIGAALGIAGASLQGLFRNPIADATLIGVTSGASLFAVFVIMLNVKYFGMLNELAGAYGISFVSFLGAACTTLLVYQLSKITSDGGVATLLLCGIAINAFVGAVTGLMTYLADDAQLRNITFWNLGSLGGASWTAVMAVAPFVGISVIFMPYLSKALNLLVLGESQAASLGVNMKLLKRQVIILATLGVGASVAVAGSIGFVGLIVPHIIRTLFGPNHRTLIIGSAIAGAIVLTLADTLSRTIVAPSELPIGILTGMLGTPFFIYILWEQKRKRL